MNQFVKKPQATPQKRSTNKSSGLIETALVLYAHKHHHLSHRVRIVMAEKNLRYDLKLIADKDDFPDLADINPYNTLPTLVDRELVLYENRVIIDYLEERYKGTKLLPDNPQERATMRQYAWRLEQDWLKLANILLTHSDSMSPDRQQQAREKLAASFVTMAPLFSHQPFFLSDTFGLCDAMLAPILWRLDDMGISLPSHLCKPLINYCDRVFARASFQHTI